jgi:hypothetical protein
MLVLQTNQYGVHLNVDLHALSLPDGTFCHKLPKADLFLELEKLKIPDVTPLMGHQELCLRFASWRKKKASAA